MRQGPLIGTPALPVIERVFGAEHPTTRISASASAFGPGGPKIRRRARDQFAALLPVRERISGAEHPDTLSTRASQPCLLDQASRQRQTSAVAQMTD